MHDGRVTSLCGCVVAMFFGVRICVCLRVFACACLCVSELVFLSWDPAYEPVCMRAYLRRFRNFVVDLNRHIICCVCFKGWPTLGFFFVFSTWRRKSSLISVMVINLCSTLRNHSNHVAGSVAVTTIFHQWCEKRLLNEDTQRWVPSIIISGVG